MSHPYREFPNSRSSNRLTISEQIDLLYYENNELKNTIYQLKKEKDEIIKNYDERLCYLEYTHNSAVETCSNELESYKSRLKELDEEIRKYKYTINEQVSENKNLKEELKKLEERYRVANQYINVLPTPHESDKLTKDLNRLKTENDRYRSKYHEAENVIRRLENELGEKSAELSNCNDKEIVMKSQMDLLTEKLSRVKCSSMVKEEKTVCDWDYSTDLFGDMHMTIRKYRDELSNCKLLIEAEKTKHHSTVINNQKRMDELQMQLESEVDTVTTLRKEIENKQSSISELEKSLKMVVNQKQNIMDNMIDLTSEIERMDVMGNDEMQTLYKRLINELKISVKETETISQCLYKLFNKEDVDITMLINCSEFDNLSIEDFEEKLLDKYYLSAQLESVKETRLRLSEIKNSLLQYCTNNMAADVKFCLTQ